MNETAVPTSSPRRIASSRANGAKSHGPTTDQGRQALKSAKRNLRHGMLAQTVVLPSESAARFEELLADLIAEHQPITRSEHALVDNMAVARWLHMRTWAIQKHDLQREMAKYEGTHPAPVACAMAFRALGADPGHTIANTLRYQTAYERQFNRAVRELKALKAQHVQSPDEYHDMSSSMPSSTWDAETLAPEEGGEFQNFPFTPSPTNGHPQ